MNACIRTMPLTFAVVLGLAATAMSAPIKVVTTLTPQGSIAAAVGGDLVRVETIARAEQDPHFVDARPSYMLKLRDADLVIVNGLDLEAGWAPLLIQGARNPRILPGQPGYLDASANIARIDVPRDGVGREAGDVHAMGNPHYWLDPANGVTMAATIAARLSELYPEYRAEFERRATEFSRRLLEKLHDPQHGWLANMAPYRGRSVITFHKSWGYFLNRFGLNDVGHLEPLPGIPPTPKHLLSLIQVAGARHVRVLLVEPYYNLAAAELVAKKTGAVVLQLPNQPTDSAGAESYFSLFDRLTGEIAGTAPAGKE